MPLTLDVETFLARMREVLACSEAPLFWREKIMPWCEAVGSVVFALRDQGCLFTPEGEPLQALEKDELLRWSDLVNLKTLFFILTQSNEHGCLVRTKYGSDHRYSSVDLEKLGAYLHRCGIDLGDESRDFPIAQYNVHIGIGRVVSTLLEVL